MEAKLQNTVLTKTEAMSDAAEPAIGRKRPASFIEGPITRTLIAFSLPIMAGSILQSLNASINAAWIGHLLGIQALAASANANALFFFLLSVSFGLSMAATILVGQSLGARDTILTKRVMGTATLFFGVLSFVIAVIGFTAAPGILQLMHTPPNAASLASAYLRIIFITVPAIFFFTFITMALRGAGDSRTPFCFMVASSALDTALNPLLITGVGPFPKLGIAGSAVATTIAQWLALILLVAWLYRRDNLLTIKRADLKYLRFDPAIIRSLLTKGIPMGLQVVAVSAAMLVLISLVNRYGSTTVAAYGACFQLWNYIQMPTFAVGSAVSSMAAQNVGAARWDRVNRIMVAGMAYVAFLTSTLIVAVTIADKAAFSLFLGQNAAAIAIAMHMHLLVSWSFILFGFNFILSSVLRATGAVIPPLIILLIAVWGVRLPMAALLSNMGIDGILWAFPAGAVASLLMTVTYYRFGRWREVKMLAPA